MNASTTSRVTGSDPLKAMRQQDRSSSDSSGSVTRLRAEPVRGVGGHRHRPAHARDEGQPGAGSGQEGRGRHQVDGQPRDERMQHVAHQAHVVKERQPAHPYVRFTQVVRRGWGPDESQEVLVGKADAFGAPAAAGGELAIGERIGGRGPWEGLPLDVLDRGGVDDTPALLSEHRRQVRRLRSGDRVDQHGGAAARQDGGEPLVHAAAWLERIRRRARDREETPPLGGEEGGNEPRRRAGERDDRRAGLNRDTGQADRPCQHVRAERPVRDRNRRPPLRMKRETDALGLALRPGIGDVDDLSRFAHPPYRTPVVPITPMPEPLCRMMTMSLSSRMAPAVQAGIAGLPISLSLGAVAAGARRYARVALRTRWLPLFRNARAPAGPAPAVVEDQFVLKVAQLVR